jgi:hypothetical protein
MQPLVTRRTESQTDGVVQHVDTVNRELAALVGGALVTFDVPPGCPVVLRGERVKLRLVQPGDPVRVTYTGARGPLVACAVEVPGGHPPPGRSR